MTPSDTYCSVTIKERHSDLYSKHQCMIPMLPVQETVALIVIQ